MTFYPKVDVSAGPPMNPQNIFLTPFIISNEGLLNLNNVDIVVALNEIKIANGPTLKSYDAPFAPRFFLFNSTLSTLAPGEKYTISNPFIYHLSPMIDRGVEYADIAVIVKFTILPLHLNMERSFRFRTSKTADGIINWYREPMAANKFF